MLWCKYPAALAPQALCQSRPDSQQTARSLTVAHSPVASRGGGCDAGLQRNSVVVPATNERCVPECFDVEHLRRRRPPRPQELRPVVIDNLSEAIYNPEPIYILMVHLRRPDWCPWDRIVQVDHVDPVLREGLHSRAGVVIVPNDNVPTKIVRLVVVPVLCVCHHKQSINQDPQANLGPRV